MYKHKAIKAYDKHKEEEARHIASVRQRQTEETTRAFLGLFPDAEPETYWVDGDQVFARDEDGEELELIYYRVHGKWAIVDKCPKCGLACESELFSNLAGLGAMIVDFMPEFGHVCVQKKGMSLEEQLLVILREFIEETVNNKEGYNE
ncbi:MAG: hypothetical protein D6706_20105 [Chloroflexi bacterium]|nr:MAG: hypothetical protein D6706_20105 [Chloroflexota bacterium]